MKRLMALLLVVVMMICVSAIASAEENNTRASDYFSSYGISLSKTGGNRINITFSCSVSIGTVSQIGVSNYSVYRYDADDLAWELVPGPHNGSYGYNIFTHSFAKTFQGVADEKYRVKCTFACVKNGTMESKAYTSRTITLP